MPIHIQSNNSIKPAQYILPADILTYQSSIQWELRTFISECIPHLGENLQYYPYFRKWIIPWHTTYIKEGGLTVIMAAKNTSCYYMDVQEWNEMENEVLT